jgi:hypothetical protein
LKQNISLPLAIAVITVFLCITAAVIYWRSGGKPEAPPTQTSMPPDVAAAFQKRMGGYSPPPPRPTTP